jgi:hypothetical protein
MALYVEYLLTPTEQRQPRTKREFAESLGITTATLSNYGREPYVQRELAERARAVARVDLLPDVIDALYAQARDPENSRSVQAAKTLIDWLDRTSPVRETPLDLEGLDEDALVTLAMELLQRSSDKKGD